MHLTLQIYKFYQQLQTFSAIVSALFTIFAL